MILDSNLEFCDATSIAASAGTAVAGDVIDLSAQGVNPGRGHPLYLVIQVTTAPDSGGAATINLLLSSDSTADLATSPTDHWQTGVLDYDDAKLAVGETFIIALPQGIDYERYLGLRVITAGATTTAGAINAFLTWDVDNWHPYPDAVN